MSLRHPKHTPAMSRVEKRFRQIKLMRGLWILSLLGIMMSITLGRAIYLQVIHKDFLKNQWNERHVRTLPLVAHRGILMDRQGEPLAISTPVESVWANPKQFILARSQWNTLMTRLGLSSSHLENTLKGRLEREFVYIKRHISPMLAHQVNELKLPGVYLQREYRRYYPAGEVTAHLLGFTNVDDVGQEGLELAFNTLLKGTPQIQQIIQGKSGQVLATVGNAQEPQPGSNLRLTIDHRLQYLAYRELKSAVLTYQAQGGSAIILDIHTGEILAMVNQPVCNPNHWETRKSEICRNRSTTDVFEPGSTLKPFIIAAALESHRYKPTSRIETHPGQLHVDSYTIKDIRNYGTLDLASILQYSSNVGASKIALSLPAQSIWNMLNLLGFGQAPGTAFPGEGKGYLADFSQWQRIDQANLAFGYGINVSLLQLVRAYAVFGNQGQLPPLRFVPTQTSPHEKTPVVMPPQVAMQTLELLKFVINPQGTGAQARIQGFHVAGKTGTVYKFKEGKYSEDEYLALFVGIAPVRWPRLVMGILIDGPIGDDHSGGKIAAPVFAKVMTEALRLLHIPPDN